MPNGHVYAITGNGTFDASNPSAPNNDYGDSLLQLSVTPNSGTPSAAFTVSQYFTPGNQRGAVAMNHRGTTISAPEAQPFSPT